MKVMSFVQIGTHENSYHTSGSDDIDGWIITDNNFYYRIKNYWYDNKGKMYRLVEDDFSEDDAP